MNYVEITKDAYDKSGLIYNEHTKYFIEKYNKNDFDLFLKSLNGKKILDVGSGYGRDSIMFKNNGFNPICVDISKTMIDLCKKNNLEAYQMNFEDLDKKFENNSFDGIWCYTSLLHIPKIKIRFVLNKIKNILKSEGIFYIGMKEGDFEGYKKTKKFSTDRYFAYYKKEELEKILFEFFEIINFTRLNADNTYYLNFLCKVK